MLTDENISNLAIFARDEKSKSTLANAPTAKESSACSPVPSTRRCDKRYDVGSTERIHLITSLQSNTD